MRINVKSERGNERVFTELGNLMGSTRRSVRQAWFALGKDLKDEANKEIKRKPKSGRVYRVKSRSGRRRRHVASAPGETHANLTGKLRRSLSWQVHGHHSMDFGYGVSTTAAKAMPRYGPFVEFGTRRMDPRPSINNAINVTQRTAEQEFLANMKREVGS